jgi:mycothiol synthase
VEVGRCAAVRYSGHVVDYKQNRLADRKISPIFQDVMSSGKSTIESVTAGSEPAVVIAALDLVLRDLPDDVRLQVREGAMLAARHELTALGELWRATDAGGATVGAVWAQVRPGGTAVVWPPQWRVSPPPEAPDPLLTALLRSLAEQGTTLAQSLLWGPEAPEAAVLVSCGFRHLADLCYMLAPVATESVKLASSAEPVEFAAVDAASWPRLREVVEQTYDGTLDCPALDGLRSAADVLDEYRTIGAGGAELWRMVRHDGADVGCLLLAEHAAQDQLELVYMGLVPAARGRNWGAAIVRQALRMAAERKRARVVLAVDAANGPALKMYGGAGFIEFDRRAAYLFRTNSAAKKS